jgi:hypothetical protein
MADPLQIYDRISEPMQKFLETLTATCASPVSPSMEASFQGY